MLGVEQGIRKGIGQFFFDFADVGVLRLFPKEKFAGFESVQWRGLWGCEIAPNRVHF
jgi:hypothetical protein